MVPGLFVIPLQILFPPRPEGLPYGAEPVFCPGCNSFLAWRADDDYPDRVALAASRALVFACSICRVYMMSRGGRAS